MPESVIQVAPDSTGKKLRTRQRVIGANTVEEQFIAQSAEPTWWAWTGSQAPAANKHLLSGLNASGSGQIIKLKKLFLFNLGIAAVTGAAIVCEFKRATAVSAGTAVVPQIMDTTDAALTNFTCVLNGTVTASTSVLWWAALNTEEMGATNAATMSWQQQQTNLMLESVEMKELVLNPGEGFTLQQLTSVAAGALGVLAGFTKAV